MARVERRLIDLIDNAADRLMTTVAGLDDDECRQPALHCAAWTRGHVITHVARSSDALRTLLTWARTGVENPAYRSQAERDAQIEAGAWRSVTELLTDLQDSARAFRSEADQVPRERWRVRVRVLGSREFPATQVLVRRLVEIELHHTDLAAEYEPSHWPAEFKRMNLDEPMHTQRESRLRR